MKTSQKDNLTDVVENLPAMTSENEKKPVGTVAANDGTRITLGQRTSKTTSFSLAKRSMNLGSRGGRGRK